jgi:hypothetical protein
MPDEHQLALRQADQARTDFALIKTELETLHARLAQVPKRADPLRAILELTIDAAVLAQPMRVGDDRIATTLSGSGR